MSKRIEMVDGRKLAGDDWDNQVSDLQTLYPHCVAYDSHGFEVDLCYVEDVEPGTRVWESEEASKGDGGEYAIAIVRG